MNNILSVQLMRAYAVIYKLLKNSAKALKEDNKNDNNIKINELLNESSKKIIEEVIDYIDTIGNADNIYNLLEKNNWDITKIKITLVKAKELYDIPNSNMPNSKLSEIKNKLLILTKNFEESKKNIKKINDSIVNQYNESLNIKASSMEEMQKINENKSILESLKKDLDKRIASIEKLKIEDIKKELENLILFDINYFQDRIKELNLIFKGKSIAENDSMIFILINLIKEFSTKDESGKKLEDSYLAVLGNADKTKQKIINISSKINELKKIEFKILNKDISESNKEEADYLTKEKKIKLPTYTNDFKLITEKIKELSILNTTKDFSKIIGLIIILTKNKFMSKIFRTMFNEEQIIYNTIKESASNELFLETEKIIRFSGLLEEMDKVMNYEIITEKQFKDFNKQEIQEEQLNKLLELRGMKKYILEKDNYTTAKSAIEEATKAFKAIDTLKLLDEKQDITERKNILKDLIKIIRELNNFNNAFFSDILSYTDFENLDKSNPGKVNCILANEIYKVKYYADLLDVLTEMNSPKTKNLQKELTALLKNRITRIKDLKKYVDNGFLKNLKDKQKVSDEDELKKLDFSKDIKKVTDAIEEVTNYINTLKSISAIVKDFIITKESFI